jgi:hypothetical protein
MKEEVLLVVRNLNSSWAPISCIVDNKIKETKIFQFPLKDNFLVPPLPKILEGDLF